MERPEAQRAAGASDSWAELGRAGMFRKRAPWGRQGAQWGACGCEAVPYLWTSAAHLLPSLPRPSTQWGRRIRDFFETPLGAVTFLFLFLISGALGLAVAEACHVGPQWTL